MVTLLHCRASLTSPAILACSIILPYFSVVSRSGELHEMMNRECNILEKISRRKKCWRLLLLIIAIRNIETQESEKQMYGKRNFDMHKTAEAIVRL